MKKHSVLALGSLLQSKRKCGRSGNGENACFSHDEIPFEIRSMKGRLLNGLHSEHSLDARKMLKTAARNIDRSLAENDVLNVRPNR